MSISFPPSRLFVECAAWNLNAVVPSYSAICERVQSVIIPYFKAGSSTFLCGFGSIEVHGSFSENRSKNAPQKLLSYSEMHGMLLLGAGFCNGLEALNDFSIVNLGKIYTPINIAGGFLFLFANLLSLEENITLYLKCQTTERDLSDIDRASFQTEQHSAIFGILSSLGYITATAFALFGASTTIALLVGVLSAFFGGLKILIDFLAWMRV